MLFKEQTVIVTGASRGIGRAIALMLAKEGANVAFNYHSSKDKAESLKKEISALGVKSEAYQVDIRDFEAVQKMREEVIKDFGKLDVLVNNAGITKDSALMMMTKEAWDDVIATNLTGTFNMTRSAIVTFMKQKKGRIINITSVSGIKGLARQANYAASKGGIISFTRSLAREVAPYNILVNAVAPGFIETDMTSQMNQDFLNEAKKDIPLQRLGTAEEVAGVVRFLLSENAQYITGQIIQIDGGMGIN